MVQAFGLKKKKEEEILGLLQLGFPAAWIFCSPELLLSSWFGVLGMLVQKPRKA